MTNTKHVTIDPASGCHLRDATPAEIAVYLASSPPAPFDRPVRVDDVLIDTWHGYGVRPW